MLGNGPKESETGRDIKKARSSDCAGSFIGIAFHSFVLLSRVGETEG